jgi:class 3 adenylate cyclase/uncharacterized membrane protein (UPF0136 family)
VDTGLERTNSGLSDDSVRQMLLLAERLREQHGGELDDAAILAVSEATGATPEYVRLAVRLLPDKRKQSIFNRIRSAFLTLEPDVRRHVLTTLIASGCALLDVLSRKTDGEALFGTLLLIMLGVGVWNVGISKDSRIALVSGAFFGGIYFVAESLFLFVANTLLRMAHPAGEAPSSFLLIPAVLGGALAGLVIQKVVGRMHGSFGIKDPQQERQELLRQLVQLQDKLRSGEQSMTFLSLDIVGSTKMKAQADPLSVEFTFTEYHRFVETVTKKYGGRVHSTAGDGVTCAFQHPQQAFGAARNVQSGIVELNTFRNKIGTPIVLRAGIHTGSVNAPTPEDIKTLNFAHVIDVASHLQHACPPGGIVVSESAVKLLTGGPSSVGSERIETDDVAAYIWSPKQRLVSLDPVLPPPAPT